MTMTAETDLRLGTKVRICLNDHNIEPGTVGTYRTPGANRRFSVIDVPGKGRVLLASHEFEAIERGNGRVWADRVVPEPATSPAVETPPAPAPMTFERISHEEFAATAAAASPPRARPAAAEPSEPKPRPPDTASPSVAHSPASRGPLPKSLAWARDWAGFAIEPYVSAADAATAVGISREMLMRYHRALGWSCCDAAVCQFYGRHLIELRDLEDIRKELGLPCAAAIKVRDRIRAAAAAAQEAVKA